MRKLLSADFSRLFKSKEFYVSIIFMIILTAFRIGNLVMSPSEHRDDDGFFLYAFVIGIVMAAFVSLFVGTDHNYHTLRNKLIVGHKRRNVYLSNYIVCTVAGWIFCSCYLVIALIGGTPISGGFMAETTDVIATILCVYLLTAAYCGIFVFLTMLYANGAATSIVCIFLAISLLVFGIYVQNKLMEPEKIEIMEYSVNMESGETIYDNNPKYISNDSIRHLYETLNNALPGGQTIQLSCMLSDIKTPSCWLFIYEGLMVLITTGLGIVLFSKKDLK